MSEIKRRSLICSFIYSVAQLLLSEVLKMPSYKNEGHFQPAWASLTYTTERATC